MSEREIVKRLFESRRVDEIEFTHDGSTYVADYGKYTKDGKNISADEYIKAREKSLSQQKITDYKKLDDEDLLILFNRKKDKRAQEELIRRYTPMAYHITKNLFMPGGDADDLAQEALIGMVSAIKDYKPGYNKDFKQFAILAMKRNAQDAVRSANTKKNSPLNQADDYETSLEMKPSMSIKSNPELAYFNKSDTKRLTDYMKKNLTPLENQVLSYYLQGYDYREIADKIGKNRKSVDNAMNKVRSKLRVYKNTYRESKLVGELLESLDEPTNKERMLEMHNYFYN